MADNATEHAGDRKQQKPHPWRHIPGSMSRENIMLLVRIAALMSTLVTVISCAIAFG